RMVLHFHRHALDRRIVARPFRHRPAAQRIAHLQAEVVVAAAGVMQLHDEDRPLPARRGLAGLGLAGAVEAPLATVVLEGHGCTRRVGARFLGAWARTSTQVGAWSLALSCSRTQRSTPASTSPLASAGLSSRWSMRRPRSRSACWRK